MDLPQMVELEIVIYTYLGPDGKLGYGGTCFPKDVNAIINFAKEHGVSMNAIEGGWNTNVEVRPERDWEKMEGRAVSK